MTKKHYKELAIILRSIPVVVAKADYKKLVEKVADVLQSGNCHFNREVFILACTE
jgi:cobalamin biosynthesis Co2+ chelatase CbiK